MLGAIESGIWSPFVWIPVGGLLCPIPGPVLWRREAGHRSHRSVSESEPEPLSLPDSDTRILPQFESRSIAVQSWWRYDGDMMDHIRSRHHGASWSLARSRISRPGCINISCCHYSPFFPLLVSKNEIGLLWEWSEYSVQRKTNFL